ncbi:tigger transposable element-derived protein 2-like [Sitodiplosis mosellana]|uniref:tigger transposable element-derived protein 2-like n=1 Tax=Sitodiplosis mosellana TaxID=263140 RepID=UPI002444B0EC|nr:tigger transposable element-derived protein 2-like [Sitodiplosis mosellana]
MIDESEVIIDESRKNNFLSLKDKAEILERLDQGESATNLASEYGISKSTISRFKKRKETIHMAITSIYPNNTDRRTLRGTFHPKMEQALYKWYVEQSNQNVDVSTAMLRSQAQIFYAEFQENNYTFSASTGWIKNFKKRFGIGRLSGNKNTEPRKRKTVNTDDALECETIEYLIETTPDCKPNFAQQITCTIKPKAEITEEEFVDDNEAYRCLETVIKWSMQRGMDRLYLTMLRKLKSKARKGRK